MKKAILVVSFGTTHQDTLKLTIEKIEHKVREEFKGYEIRRAFTAHIIIKVLKERDRIYIDTPEEALGKLRDEGYEEVIVQPLHIIPGAEFDYIKLVVDKFKEEKAFKSIKLGRPALFFQKGEDTPDDYCIFIDSIKSIIPKDKEMVFMGHGTAHHANACYSCLQYMFIKEAMHNVHIGTVDGYPTLQDIIRILKKKQVKELKLAPLMLVAGDHAKNDMASEEEDSWQSMLKAEGMKVDIYLHGLGEIDAFQDIYLEHIKDAIEGTYDRFMTTHKKV